MKSEQHFLERLSADAPAESQSDGDDASAQVSSIDKQLTELRAQISDLGYELDSNRTGIAASMGGGVFMILLAAIAGYDLSTGKASIWSPLGVTEERLSLIAWTVGAAGLALLLWGLIRRRRFDRKPEARLEELEQEYSRLLDRRDRASQDQP